MKELNRSRLSLGFLIGVVTTLSLVLFFRTLSYGDDFQVFYQVAHRFWDGVRPYDRVTFGNMVFKYPPWILPFFLLFGVLDLFSAKVLWGLIEVVSLVVIVTRIHRGVGDLPPVRPWIQGFFLLIFFGLFGNHGMTGQITLTVLALALTIDPVRDSFGKFFILCFSLSSKLTSLFPILHVGATRPRRKKLILSSFFIVLLFIALSLPIYFKSYNQHYGQMRDEWVEAMFSGTQDVNSVRIGFTTREVQGLPSFLLRNGGLDEKNSTHVLFAIGFSALFVGIGWSLLSRKLSPSAQWLGWLALLPAVQPLAWFHVFLFTYPLIAVGVEATLRDAKPKQFWKFFMAALLVGAVTVKTLGPMGSMLEMLSIKLWGSFMAVAIFRKAFQSIK